MEVAESREPGSVGPPTGAESTVTNGDQNPLLDDSLMDDRSSSLSEIDYVSENEPSDYEPVKPEKTVPENDSEAETERIEDSPHSARWRKDIVLSAASSHGPSPSKLAQSTTYEEAEDDEDDEEHVADDSPSKPRSKSNGVAEATDETPGLEDSTLSDSLSKKRKRFETGGDDTGTEFGEDEPPNKRRGSVKSDLSDPPADTLTPEPFEEPPKPTEDDTPADEVPESDLPAAPVKGKKGKKGKRKTRKTRDLEEETEVGGAVEGPEGGADDHLEDDDTAERGEEVDDAEAAAKHEEESKKMSAMESLTVLEREFATLRDKIYDEKIFKLNRELEMLTGPNPTHPEYLRQLECVQRYRDAKVNYEHTLFQYRLKALLNKSLAERAQTHSTFFQRARDIRERHSSAISQQFYAIQHDRFKTEEISPHHYIPFPTRRSQQIAHQTAYNQEVSVMAGVAKYVGFPAAPSLAPARPSELDDDLEKMGISVEPRISASQPSASSSLPRGAMSALSSNAFRTAAEEAFLEQTPWANPQHPVHQQQTQTRPQGRVFEHPRAPSYTTPAAQKRVVDVNAPNGSASTIAENPSATNSPANNTPYGTEQEQPHLNNGHFVQPDYDADRKSGFRSQSSSPLDMRKPHPHLNHALGHRSPPEMRPDNARNNAYSPPPARLGLFHAAASKRDSSPSLSKPANSVHQSTGVGTGPASNQMAAR
ncbi:hypothetical protein ASPWEDRAFT_117354 [Aspergillus wentii DTO 134E9]|uniref:Transcriptional regulatory protein DEP1 n=1 Tax=Aspergillus wentii DTO 134E9 TaxID=1073089 RepID=A0A1L9RA99_ASPWE|nr:uncharacterized protein ASPWEDRAFT_117354 [Aspergillus wentii DTO 134E9]OJJ31854.1 hypothetical protein ASPWEDRAFT_117354 [Aspergillus wentii DTO 134E9]